MKSQLLNERLEQVLFYTLEKAIKSYRQFAQRRIAEQQYDITIDQWLILKTIHDNPDISQRDIAESVFKDQASITRLIDALVQKGFLERKTSELDRRRVDLALSQLGEMVLSELDPLIQENRKTALHGFDSSEVNDFREYLEKIIQNCNS